jgi:hypothetical protein
MNSILITRPEHDHGTRYLSRWSEYVIEAAKKKGLEVIDLHREKAARADFEGRMRKIRPSFVLMNGHGSERCITGHDNEILVTLGENEEMLFSCITYAVSCDSAAELGSAIAKRARATYIGYTKSFVFNFNPQYLNQPTRDSRAGQFLNASNQVSLALIKGHSAQEASERSKSTFRKALRILLSSKGNDQYDAKEDIKDLYWDMIHLVCLGDGNATL